MRVKHIAAHFVAKFFRSTSGNFAIMTAICLPVLFGIGGAAIEVARAMQIKSDLQSVADASVLSATTKARIALGKLKDEELKKSAGDYIASSQFASELTPEERDAFLQNIAIGTARTQTEKGEEFAVTAALSYNLQLNPLLRFIGQESLLISVESSAKSSFNNGAALSLYMLLDRSRSMSEKDDSGVVKMAALKLAVRYLTDTLRDSDPSYSPSGQASKLVRTGAISYNHNAFAEAAMAWGTKHSLDYANKLPAVPDGYTSAVNAMKAAIKALERKNTKEKLAHESAGNASFERYIVFMTDGEMTGSSADWSKSIDTQVRTLCETAKTDGIVIFSVAFAAPDNGQNLLKACASSTSHYYEPEKMTDLIAAFGDIARKASSKISALTH